MKLEFSRQIFEKKNTQMSNLVKMCAVGAELLHEDGKTHGRTDMTKLVITALRNFANEPDERA